MSDQAVSSGEEKTQNGALAYWKANLRLIIILLVIWALVSYVLGILLAPALSNIYLGQLPVGFWFAQQGSMYVFVILIFVYSKLMDNVDKEFDVHE
jgi:putative solute:sodium symporter small subunit